MRLEHIFLVYNVVTIDDITCLVTSNQEFLVVRPSHGIDAVSVHITALEVVEV